MRQRFSNHDGHPSIPFLWACMDLAASDAKMQHWLIAINWLLSGLTMCWLACPLNIDPQLNLAMGQ